MAFERKQKGRSHKRAPGTLVPVVGTGEHIYIYMYIYIYREILLKPVLRQADTVSESTVSNTDLSECFGLEGKELGP